MITTKPTLGSLSVVGASYVHPRNIFVFGEIQTHTHTHDWMLQAKWKHGKTITGSQSTELGKRITNFVNMIVMFL